MRLAVHRDARPVHHFKQCRLGLGRRSIDLIGQNDIGENRALLEYELFDRLVVNRDAGHIARQEIAGELNARKHTIHRARQ